MMVTIIFAVLIWVSIGGIVFELNNIKYSTKQVIKINGVEDEVLSRFSEYWDRLGACLFWFLILAAFMKRNRS